MSHTIRKINLSNSALVESTIVDYNAGGEAYTLAELGLTGALVSVAFLAIIGQPGFIPILQGGTVVIQARPGVEIQPTIGLNFSFVAIVHAT